ncbi:hypothetical protein ACSPAB_04885 [Buttiauxella agrestis]
MRATGDFYPDGTITIDVNFRRTGIECRFSPAVFIQTVGEYPGRIFAGNSQLITRRRPAASKRRAMVYRE